MPRENIELVLRMKGDREAAARAQRVDRAVDNVGRTSARTGRAARAAAGGIGALGGAAKSALAFGGIAGLGMVLSDVVAEHREAEKASRSTAAAIKSTGGAANVTANEVADLAGRLSVTAAIDDEEIQGAANKLLTFKNVANQAGEGNDVFTQSMSTAVDMAARYGQSLDTSVIQLGKALQEPEKGAAALKRTGAIGAAELEKVKEMAEQGVPLLEQQRFLLDQINEAGVKGAAASQADPFDRLAVSIANVEEAAGGVIVPPLAKAADAAAKFFGEIADNKGDGAKFLQTMQGIGQALEPIGHTIKDVAEASADLGRWLGENPGRAKALGVAVMALGGTFVALKTLGRVSGWAQSVAAGFDLIRRRSLTAADGVASGGRFTRGVGRGIRRNQSGVSGAARSVLRTAGTSAGGAAADAAAGSMAGSMGPSLRKKGMGSKLKSLFGSFGTSAGGRYGLMFAAAAAPFIESLANPDEINPEQDLTPEERREYDRQRREYDRKNNIDPDFGVPRLSPGPKGSGSRTRRPSSMGTVVTPPPRVSVATAPMVAGGIKSTDIDRLITAIYDAGQVTVQIGDRQIAEAAATGVRRARNRR